MVWRRFNYTLILVFFASIALTSFEFAYAQMDPTSSILLNSRSSNPSGKLESDRYTIKAGSANRAPKADREFNRVDAAKIKIRDKAEEIKEQAQRSQSVEKNKTESVNQETKPAQSVLVTEDRQEQLEENRTVLEELRDSLFGGDPDAILNYKDQLHPEDPRQNILNISVAPSMMYIDSNSNYWFRRYHSSGPGLDVEASIWITPFLGIEAEYLTSLVADVNNEPDSARKVNVDHTYTTAGIVFRKYTSLSRRSSWFKFGLKYSDYKMMVPKADPYRIRILMQGLAVDLETHIPTSYSSGWFFTAQIIPKEKVREESTGIVVNSGSSPSTYSIQFGFGQEFSFSRHSQIFWKLSHRLDKTVYQGSANANDPRSGTAPSGVSVSNGLSIFSVGYTWGD